MSDQTRRTFLTGCTASLASIWVLKETALADAGPHVKFPTVPRERIAIASYPFREFLTGADYKGPGSPIALTDFVSHVRSKFNVNKMEPWSAHFPSTDRKYLDTLRAAVEKSHGAVANIAVDGEHSPYAADKSEREQAIAFGKKWVDVAAAIGSPSIRTNIPEAKDSQPNLERTAESLSRVVEYSATKSVVVHVENDNPVSEDPFFLVKLVEKVRNPWLHPLPDFANSLAHKDAGYAYRGIEQLFAHAYGICHVKKMEQADNGQVVQVDMAKTFAILKASGYRGYCSMEFDSPGDPYKGTQELIDETLRYLS